MRKYQPWAFAAALFLFIGAVSPDSNEKELIIRLQGEVIVLQRQVRDMQEFLDKWQARSSDSLTKIATEMDSTSRGVASLEESVKNSQLALRNNSTGTANQMAKLTEQVTLNTQQSAQIRKQLESLQQALQQYQTKLESRERSANGLDSSTPTDPELLFSSAYLQFSRKNYESAINLFTQYHRLYPRSEKADDALFWAAESLLEGGKPEDALRLFDRVLTDYPQGDKTAGSALKKGISLLRLERRDEGVAALKAVVSSFPDSAEATTAREELRRLGETGATTSPNNNTRPRQR